MPARGSDTLFAQQPYGLKKRVPWTSSRVAGFPDPPPPFQLQRVYAELTFERPIATGIFPGNDLIWVATHQGDYGGDSQIRVFADKPDDTMSNYQTVCTIGEIPEGEARVFTIDKIMVSVFNVGGEFCALEDRCPHAGASLALGSIEGDLVRCRIHHWGFCLRDGVYADEDNPNYNARSFPVRIVDNQVQICIDR